MKQLLAVLLLVATPLIHICPANAQNAHVPPGSKLFIAPMEGELNGFIATEIIKQKLPVKIITDDAAADYVLTGASLKADDKWYNTVFGGKDKNEGNVQLLNAKEKTVIWAGEAGDRSLWFGSWKRGGERKVAERIVSKMKRKRLGNTPFRREACVVKSLDE